MDAIAEWLNNTATDLPFTDLYNMVGHGHYRNNDNGDPIKFAARPVQGAHFALLAIGGKGGEHDLATLIGRMIHDLEWRCRPGARV